MPPPATCATCGRKVNETKAIYKCAWDIYLCDEACEMAWKEKEDG